MCPVSIKMKSKISNSAGILGTRQENIRVFLDEIHCQYAVDPLRR